MKKSFQKWLSNYFDIHSINKKLIKTSIFSYIRLIRDAYIIDTITCNTSSSTSISNFNEYISNNIDHVNNKNLSMKWPWDTMQVKVVGYNGDLPNMDLIATVLSIGPKSIMTECDIPIFYPQLQPLSLRSGTGYNYRLAGLLGFVATVLRGSTGYHADLLYYGIDAITIKLGETEGMGATQAYRQTRAPSNDNGQRQHRVDSNKHRESLLDLMEGLLFASSNLHGSFASIILFNVSTVPLCFIYCL